MKITLRRHFDVRAKDFSMIINEYWLERSNDIWTLWQDLSITAEASEHRLNAFYELCVCFQALKRQEIAPQLVQQISQDFYQVIEKEIDAYFAELCTFFCAESWISELELICEKLEGLEKKDLSEKSDLVEEKISKYQGKINELWQEWEDAAFMYALLSSQAQLKSKNPNEKEELDDLGFEMGSANQWIMSQPKVFTRIGLHLSAKAWAMKEDFSQWDETMRPMLNVYIKVLDACDEL